jgi:signal peptidase II
MTEALRRAGSTYPRLEVWLPLLVVAVDQATKAAIRATVPLHETVEVLPRVLNLTHVRNTGAAFGMLNAADFPLKTAVLVAMALTGLAGVAWYSLSLAREQLMARAGLSLIIGGAAGNLIDRVVEGSVLDFVDVYWRTYHFWAFNVADSAITIGVVVMLLDMLKAGARVSKTV